MPEQNNERTAPTYSMDQLVELMRNDCATFFREIMGIDNIFRSVLKTPAELADIKYELVDQELP